MTHSEIANAIHALKPGANWTFSGTSYSGLTWLDEVQTKPTAEEIGI